MQGLARWWSRMPVAGRVVVGLAVALLVFAVVWLSVDLVAGLMVLAIIAVAAGLFLLIRFLVVRREKRKGQGLAGKLWAGMSGGAGSGLDESSEELSIRQEMEGRWKNVYETLRERRYDYYSFPWYLIIGAAQSGKTTTIQKSNQEFPIGDEPVVDYGGTKGCNWFFTNQAIIIDTAGRYVEHLGEDDAEWDSMLARDQEEWDTFLKLLREGRSRSPVNGVIITIKLEDVLEQDPRRRKKVTDSMRKALLDIEEKLAVRVPVYVLVTMCDLLVGFVDYFANLPGLSDRTLFGWSRTAPYDKEFDAAEFGPAFTELSGKVDAMLLDFLEAQAGRGGDLPADVTRTDRMLAFPDEFRSLGEPLQQLLAEIFKKSAYNEQHFVRGVYFTSGVQEGRPVMNACLSLVGDGASGLQEDDVSLAGEGSKAYFIADLYEEKVFKEAGLVRMTRRAQSTQRLKKYGYSGVAAALAIAAGLWVATEIAAVNALELYAPERLQQLTEREVQPADLRLADDGVIADLSDLAAAVERMGQPEYSEASLLGGQDVADARRSLHAASRRLFAEKALDPLLGDTFAEWRTRTPASWSECAALTDALLATRALGQGRGTLDDLRDGLLARLKLLAPADDARPDFDGLLALAAELPDDDGREGLAAVRRVAASHAATVDELLAGPVLGWWTGWLGAVQTPLARQGDWAGLRPDLAELDPLWTWQGLKSLDDELERQLDELIRVLGDVPSAPRELAAFQQQISAPWSGHFGDADRLRGFLDAHLAGLPGTVEVGPVEAHGRLVEQLAPLTDLDLRDASEADLRDAIADVEERVSALKAPLESWVDKNLAAVVDLQRAGGGLATAGGDALGTEAGLTWRPESKLDAVRWQRLVAIDRLVAYRPADDDAASPATRDFWDLASGFERWFAAYEPPQSEADGGALPEKVRELMNAADVDTLDTLRTQKLSAFAAHLVGRLDDAGGRQAFLDEMGLVVEGPRVNTLELTGLPTELERHAARADVAAGLVQVTTTLRAEVNRRKADLSSDAQKLPQALVNLLERYASHVLRAAWSEHGRDDVDGDSLVELARRLQTVPAPPPAGWEQVVAWRQGLASDLAELSGFSTLARYAADQDVDLLKLALKGLNVSAVDAAFAETLELWSRYRADGGARAEEAAQTTRQLATALTELSRLGTAGDAWQRLDAVQSGAIYEGLMAPQRLAEAWGAGGLDDPTLGGLRSLALGVRATLGAMASEFFHAQWADLGQPDQPGGTLSDKFPFCHYNLSNESNESVLASLDDTRALFADERFQRLRRVIYAHIDPVGPGSPSLYDVDFGAGELGETFRRCVQLGQLCGFVAAGERAPEVRIELFEGYTESGDPVPLDWTFELAQEHAGDNARLTLPFEASITGDGAPLWRPQEPSRVTWKARADDEDRRSWEYDGGPLSDEKHWTSVLLFVYGVDRGDPLAEAEAVAPSDVRWIDVRFRRSNRQQATHVIGVRMQGMPDELPDLRGAFGQG